MKACQTTFETFSRDADECPSAYERAEWPVYRFGCRNCARMFHATDSGADCPDCGRKHPTQLGFVGDVELAEAVEAADLPEHVDPARLTAESVIDVLEATGEPIPEVVPNREGLA